MTKPTKHKSPYDDSTSFKGGLAELFPHTWVHRTMFERLMLLAKGKGWKDSMELTYDSDCTSGGIDKRKADWWKNASR